MTKAKEKVVAKAPEPVKKSEQTLEETIKDLGLPTVEKAKAEPVKASKGFKAINSSTVCQLCRRADRTFGITV